MNKSSLTALIIAFLFLTFKSLFPTGYKAQVEGRKKLVFETEVANLHQIGVLFPRVAAAQVVRETDAYRSNICRTSNNLFGMKNNKRSRCISLKDRPKQVDRLHCYYLSRRDSRLDYRDWQKARLAVWTACGYKFPTTELEYLHFLSGYPLYFSECEKLYPYAEHTVYTNKLKSEIKIWGDGTIR